MAVHKADEAWSARLSGGDRDSDKVSVTLSMADRLAVVFLKI